MINYKNFLVNELFFIPNEKKFKKYSKIPIEKGNIPFISSKESNNGISTYCKLKPEVSNCITVSTNGECLKCFYHNYDIIPSSDVEILILKDRILTPEIACYLNTCIEKHKYKFHHSNKPKNGVIYKLKIKLPIKKDNGIDWDYMTQYIKKIEFQYIKKIETYLKIAKLNSYHLLEKEREIITNYKQNSFFNVPSIKISDIFSISNNPSLDKKQISFNGNINEYPYFTRSVLNNGEIGYTKKIPMGFLIKGNSIAVGLMGMKFFYKSCDFCAGQFTKTLHSNNIFTDDLAMFYITFLNKNSNILKANLVRDFNNIVNEMLVPNLSNNEIKIFIDAIKKLVIKDLIEWKNIKLKSFPSNIF